MNLQDFNIICINNGMTLDEGYALYQLYRHNKNGPPDVPIESMKKLIEKELYVDGKTCQKLYTAFANAEQNSGDGSDYQKTMEMHDETLRITTKVRRKETSVIPVLDLIISNMLTILMDFEHGKEEKEIYAKALEFFNNDRELAEFYMIWYYLFPTVGAKNNGWEKLFYVKFDGFRLRNSGTENMKFFKSSARKLDMRIFLIGTFLFIKNGIGKDGRCFINSQTNFRKIAQQWYMTAIDTIDQMGENIIRIFDPVITEKNQGNSGNLV